MMPQKQAKTEDLLLLNYTDIVCGFKKSYPTYIL